MREHLSNTPERSDPIDPVLRYHQRTKHTFHAFAPSPGYLDWKTQPDPFRRYQGAPLIGLEVPETDTTPVYESLFNHTPVDPRPVTAGSISALFYYALALSAWKGGGNQRWALRVNPSSGNLHPTEGYLVIHGLHGLQPNPGVYHYAPGEHGLEHRSSFGHGTWEQITDGLPGDAFLVGLTSIHWRESWKYGERAWRYCQHDAGHALAALRLSAAALGWRLTLLPAVTDDRLGRLLGLADESSRPEDAADEYEMEREHPDLLAAVFPPGGHADVSAFDLPSPAVDQIASGCWQGRANRLSPGHRPWPVIDSIARACRKDVSWAGKITLAEERLEEDTSLHGDAEAGQVISGHRSGRLSETAGIPPRDMGLTAGQIIRQRRSAVDMDPEGSMDLADFLCLLSRLLPHSSQPPWDALHRRPMINLGLFVHRVSGLEPGLYALVRNRNHLQDLKVYMNPEFHWQHPPGVPEGLPLYLLESNDTRRLAELLSCTQEIAGNSAFSLGMIARFESVLKTFGAPLYRHLFWEAGAIGQMLYLEAEASGLRGTGIGCYFDDSVHQAFGLEGFEFQSLYHFTVGRPIEDSRLTTLPAYPAPRETNR